MLEATSLFLLLADATSDTRNAELAKVIADYLPWMFGVVSAAVPVVSGAIWYALSVVYRNVLIPLKDKAISTVDETKDKHFELIDSLKTNLNEQTIQTRRQADAAEQSASVLSALNTRVEQVAETQVQHFAACKGVKQA